MNMYCIQSINLHLSDVQLTEDQDRIAKFYFVFKSTDHVLQVKEDIDAIQRLKILIDYDDNGYLLQVLLHSICSQFF